jgi:hypothetical protein
MTKPNAPKGKSPQASKLSRKEMAEAIHSKHQHIRDAVHNVLREAGLQGVSVHSVRFMVAQDSMSGPGCNPPCSPNEDCVIDSSGGDVRWICVPR